MQTIFESTKEFELHISFPDTDIFLIQECVIFAIDYPELAEYWADTIALVITMMDAEQRNWFQFERLYPDALKVATSVAAALSWHFAILVNKLGKILKIFEQLDHI